jgi:hypothetical protein
MYRHMFFEIDCGNIFEKGLVRIRITDDHAELRMLSNAVAERVKVSLGAQRDLSIPKTEYSANYEAMIESQIFTANDPLLVRT